MMDLFDACFEIVIGHEGGYSNDPRDPGGETKYGISKRAYPQADIRNLTLDGAKAIYRRDYWDKLRCDELHPGIALVLFDAGVNVGVGRAASWAQTAAGVKVDGVIGPVSVAALNRMDPLALITEVHASRIHHHASLPTWGTFGKGWSRRLAALPYQAAQIAQQLGAGGPSA
jgi:lysozyme family protein